MLTADLLAEIKTVLPELKMAAGEQNHAGKVFLLPKSEEEISQILKYCHDHEKTINIIAGNTKGSYGNPAEKADVQLSLTDYTGIVEHTVGDMTVTVKSGTRFKELQEYLAKHNQKVALDPFWPDDATIGGIIAANDSGPKRLGYGTARDSVIGLRMVYPDGRIIRAGGRVVKNVAGYDMNKVFIGSMGTLGVISEVTLKLRPLPNCESLILLSFPEGDFEEIQSYTIRLLDSVLEPVAVELFNPSISQELFSVQSCTLAVSFEDVKSSVLYQEEFINTIKPSNANMKIYRDFEAKACWNQIYTVGPSKLEAMTKPNTEIKAMMKIGVINMKVIDLIRECQVLSDRYAVLVFAHGGLATGVVQLTLQGADEDVLRAIHDLRKLAVQLGGYGIVRYLPVPLYGKVDVWGEKPSYFPLLEGIKVQIDPKRILNPKRFVGGI